MSNYFENFFSKFQCGFGQGFSAQYCPSRILHNTFGALLTYLSKTFDCLPHYLFIAKLNAYGFSLSSKLIDNYLSCRKQRTNINNSYSS